MIKIYRREKPPSRWLVPMWMLWGIIQIPLIIVIVFFVCWWRWARLTQLQSHRNARTFRQRMAYRMATVMMGYTMGSWDDPNNPYTKSIKEVTEVIGDQAEAKG